MSENNAKYRQVYETLRSSILSGKYPADKPMPSLRSLVRKHGFSTITIRRAFDELERQGLIARRRGSGTFVSKSGSARKIGLIVPGMAYSEFFPPIVSEISRLSQKEDYNLLFGDIVSKSPERRVQAAKKLSREFVEQGVAGVLYQPLELVENVEDVNCEILSVFDKVGVSVVILDNDFMSRPCADGHAYDVVGIDNVAAGALVAGHLIGLGVRRIAFLKRPKCSSSVNERWRGVASASLFGAPSLRTSVLVAEPEDVNAVRRHLRRFKPEAFVCGNDAAAVALKQSLERVGKCVPEDVLLAGFDDVQFAKIVSPQLTTVHQPCEKIAETAFYRLLARIANPSLTPVRIALPVSLVVRGSTMAVSPSKQLVSKTRRSKWKN